MAVRSYNCYNKRVKEVMGEKVLLKIEFVKEECIVYAMGHEVYICIIGLKPKLI